MGNFQFQEMFEIDDRLRDVVAVFPRLWVHGI